MNHFLWAGAFALASGSIKAAKCADDFSGKHRKAITAGCFFEGILDSALLGGASYLIGYNFGAPAPTGIEPTQGNRAMHGRRWMVGGAALGTGSAILYDPKRHGGPGVYLIPWRWT